MNNRSELCPELPASPRRIAVFAIAALSFGICLAIWIDRPRGPECVAILSARTTFVTAKSEGTLTEFLVEQGAPIQIGDPLLKLTDETLERRIADKQREIASLQSEVQRALATAELEMNWRTRTLQQEICDIQLRSASFLKEKYNFELQRSMLSDLLAGNDLAMTDGNETLFQSVIMDNKMPSSNRMATILEMELASNAAEVSAAQVEICEIRQQQLHDLIKAIPTPARKTAGVDVAEANLARAELEVEQLLKQQSDLTIASPSIGRVGLLQGRPGDHLRPGDPIVELLDDARRYLVAYVPSQEITSFEVGSGVALTFPGRKKMTGHVTEVAPQATHCFQGNPHMLTTDHGDATILVTIEPTGKVWPQVPIGSQVKVRLDRSGK